VTAWRKGGIDPPWWWKPWLRLPSLREFWQREREVRPGSVSHGFGYLTLDPSPRLRRLRERLDKQQRERTCGPGPFGKLPPLPDSAYGPDAVPLDEA
jgi:hypothetical protein